MRILYFDCGMGAAGDMLTAALLELLPNQEAFLEKLNEVGLPGIHVTASKTVKCGIGGTHVSVKVHGEEETSDMHGHSHHYNDEHSCHHEHEHHHDHHSFKDIEDIVKGLNIPEKVKEDILAVYRKIAQAESHVHGVPVTDIHFHEVGTMDALADVTAVCMLMDELHPGQVIASPIHVGSGQVRCAHGILPVPAPATAHILKQVPIYGGNIKGELCTPTGAALLTHFVTQFGEMPIMKTQAIGYGMGSKDFEAANCVRVLLGERDTSGDTIVKLSCNLDDMTPEAIGFAKEQLLSGGALDVYTVSIEMKKSRPGVLLEVLCREEDEERLIKLLFMHTTTLGIRQSVHHRYTLSRTTETIMTPFGPVRKKVASGYGVTRSKFEYEDVARIAKEQNVSLEEVLQRIHKQE